MDTTDTAQFNRSPQVNDLTAVQPTPGATPGTGQPVGPGAPVTAATSANSEPKRVARLRAAVVEARGVVALQSDPALTAADTDRVLAERRKAAEAYKLHQLAGEPARKALRDMRMRRTVALVGAIGLVGALGWSCANVQHAVVAGQHLGTGDAAWWLAFLVEPVVSVGLLLIFGVRAYIAATRAISISDHRLRRAEFALLAITLTVNSWLYLPGVAAQFDPLQLLVHSIGPVIAVTLVTVIPVLWQYLSDLGEDTNPDPDLVGWLTLARDLIAEGALAPHASRTALEKALRARGGRISTSTAMKVHRSLTGGRT